MEGYPRVPTASDTDVVGRRIGAEILDILFSWISLYFLIGLLAILRGAFLPPVSPPEPGSGLDDFLSALLPFLALGLGVFVMIPFFLEGLWDGQTPGKWIVGIKVVQADGAPCTVGASALRRLGLVADFLPAFYIAGAVSIAMSSRRQRLGDRLAGTVVVWGQPEQSEGVPHPKAAGEAMQTEARQDMEEDMGPGSLNPGGRSRLLVQAASPARPRSVRHRSARPADATPTRRPGSPRRQLLNAPLGASLAGAHHFR
ncbi:MAG: RDD family protein [Salinibacter sp.]|uniref:RDD family protein n=1 Tax=Salinibacter sp. TaxID=2065818 RepID=UPI0035D40600